MPQAGSGAVDTEAAASVPATTAQERSPGWVRAVVGAPELLVALAAGFSIGPMILLLAGAYTAPVAFALGIPGAILAGWACGIPSAPASRRAAVLTLIAAVVALAWFAYNVRYSAQDVYATRDPATYTLAARWLMDHHSLVINAQPQLFGSPHGADIQSGGFQTLASPYVYAQGDHLLPVMLSMGGSALGVTALFKINVAIGAFALFALFGLARRIVGPVLALVAMATLAVSIPMIYVARDTYSEPLTLLFLAGGLAILHRAMTSRRVADFAVAGLVAGCSAMVRIDSYAALIGVAVTACFVGAVAAERRPAVLRAAALLGGAGLPVLLGWMDVAQLSPQYYNSQHHNIMTLLVMLAAVLVVGGALAWRLGPDTRLRAALASSRVRNRLTAGASIVIVLAFAVLASRPLWQQTHGHYDNPNLQNMQRYSHVPVDGTRLYNEQTVHWLAMYFGWLTVVLAVAGYAVLVNAFARRCDYALVGVLTTGLGMSALYLWTAQITPDQPWAMRRYVPVVLPVMIIAAVAALGAAVSWAARRRRPLLPGAALLAVGAAVVMVVVPLRITRPVAHLREEYPQYPQLQALCAALGHDAAVVEVDASAGDGYGQTLRSYCGVPTIILEQATPGQLAPMQAAVARQGRTLYLLSQDPSTTAYASGRQPPPFSSVTTTHWPSMINEPPRASEPETRTIFLATVDSAGLAHAVPPR